jgi:hypothetical protein
VAISPGGTWLATVGEDWMARIWAADGASGTAIRVDGAIHRCEWIPGGADLLVAGHRGIYRFSIQSPES